MEFQDAQKFALRSINEITRTFQKVPGSAMLIRYIQSSYQDDPEIDDLVDEWTPEPLVAPQTPFEEADAEKLPVIVG
ncbi:unnamed protein product [Sphagnum balticum]